MAKGLVLLGGLCGLVAFFLPFMVVPVEGTTVGVSMFHFMKGEAGLEEAFGKKAETEGDREALREASDAFEKDKGLFLAFYAPAALLVLLGLVGLVSRFGRGLGLIAMLAGIIGFGGWLLIHTALGEAAKEQARGMTEGLGVTLLLVSASLGCLGALMALARPEPRAAVGAA
jgi:hypothetical protein